ncbi:MAG TPA: hypothetical protein VKZ76_06735 [Edaphocola sp.]|nr:hypothetical protein [Edaphocola sp.]
MPQILFEPSTLTAALRGLAEMARPAAPPEALLLLTVSNLTMPATELQKYMRGGARPIYIREEI